MTGDPQEVVAPGAGNPWLARTPEEALEPGLPICDTHHHFWDGADAFAPYDRYLLPELVADVGAGHHVRSTVFVECKAMYRPDGPAQLRPVGEVEFVQGQAAISASGSYGPCRAAAAIVGYADLKRGDAVKPVLEALRQASVNRFRGVRHSVGWDPHPASWDGRPLAASPAPRGILAAPEFLDGARALAGMGLTLDTQVYPGQLPELAAFARAVPGLTIVVNHMAGLIRVGAYANRDDEVMPLWREAIAAVADCPNVILKVGGLGMPRTGFGWHARAKPVGSVELAATMGPLIAYCVETLGAGRCMFESNFPVDKVSFSHVVLLNAFKRLSAGWSSDERAAVFHDTAARAYGIGAD